MAGPPPHPEPPPGLDSLALPLVSIEPGGEWMRLYACRHHTAIHFNRELVHRFNAPDREYGVLYVGDGIACAFVETFGDSRGPGGTIEIAEADLGDHCLAAVDWSRTLRAVDLTGSGLARIGADARLVVGHDYEQSRRWARALWNHPAAPDGILYPARRDPIRRSLALFDRTVETIRETQQGTLVDSRHEAALGELLERYGVALL